MRFERTDGQKKILPSCPELTLKRIRMNRNSLLAWFAMIPLTFVFCNNRRPDPLPGKGSTTGGGKGFAVVELFTSEGCSSCPAAEKAVEELQHQFPQQVYVLAYHVDYWDRLGWKDAFSSSLFSDRQRDYAVNFKLESIYTPQAVINGMNEFVGSDKSKLDHTVRAALLLSAVDSISILTSSAKDGWMEVKYSSTTPANEMLQVALVQNEATSGIKRGENAGLSIHHINIVRELKEVKPGAGTIMMKLPAGLEAGQVHVVAFLQKQDGRVTAAMRS